MSDSFNGNCFGSKIISFRGRNSVVVYLLPIAICFLLSLVVKAQDEDPPNAAPPPVKAISKNEKSALAAASDVKIHTKLAIDLMDARLKKAEELMTQELFTEMFDELGGFHALMDDTIKFLNRNDTGRGKVLDNFKRFELALRAFTPRIELIRRELPERFEFYVRRLLKIVRDTRAKAVEPLFTDAIVPNNGN